MTLPAMSRLILPVSMTLAVTLMAVLPVSAQSPAATQPAATTEKPADAPPTAPTPSPVPATPAPETVPAPPSIPPAPSATGTPAAPLPPPAASTTTPSVASPTTEAPANPPPTAQSADPFGEEVTLTAKKVVALKGKAVWDSAFETLTDSIKTLTNLLAKQNIKAAGPVIIVYTSTDDSGFTFQAEIPVDQDPKNLTKDMSVAQSPEGKVLKFVHHGSYDNMDNTYEAITNYLDDKKLEAKDTFIEEYVTDPLKVEEDKLVINVFVPLK
jgi:effector-binding domain-containing protein